MKRIDRIWCGTLGYPRSASVRNATLLAMM